MSNGANRAIFLDRDATIIEDKEYSVDASKLTALPGALEGLKKLQNADYLLFIVTNQSGVARGFFDEAALWLYNSLFEIWLKKQGISIAGTYYCPHYPEGIVPGYTRVCPCRKPEPGLVLRAAKEHDVDLRSSWMIGDRAADIGAGRAAGCRSIRIGQTGESDPKADFDAPDLSKAADIILKNG